MVGASQDVVHEPLEGLASILWPKRHPQELPQPEGGNHSLLGHVIGRHRHLPIPLPEVDGGEQLHPLQLGRKVLNVWRWVQVRLCYQVELVVSIGPPGPVLLFDQVEGRGPTALRLPHNPLLLHGQELVGVTSVKVHIHIWISPCSCSQTLGLLQKGNMA